MYGETDAEENSQTICISGWSTIFEDNSCNKPSSNGRKQGTTLALQRHGQQQEEPQEEPGWPCTGDWSATV